MLDRHRELLEDGELAVVWHARDDGTLECTVVAPDRRGLLAAGRRRAHARRLRHPERVAATATPTRTWRSRSTAASTEFGRLDDAGQTRLRHDAAERLEWSAAAARAVSERVRRYRGRPCPAATGVDVLIDLDASASSTVIEVHAPDQVGLLAPVAAVFADLDVDCRSRSSRRAETASVDVFYVRDAHGAKPSDP